jgi:FdhD protein
MLPLERISHTVWKPRGSASGERAVPEETAIALTYNGGSYAVMMATPQDLEDFAYGFSLTEGIVSSVDEIESLEVIEGALGIELRIRLTEPYGAAYSERRRYMAGPTGCGLCGIESLEQAMRMPRKVLSHATFSTEEIVQALATLASAQNLHRETQAVHAAAFWSRRQGLVALREDVGRHNALDKLAGSLALRGIAPVDGLAVFTSRVSVEMIQKAAAIGVPLAVAISVPTALAVRMAEAAGITLIAVARDDGFEIFTHAERVLTQTPIDRVPAHVA